ncbi:MAG: dnaE2 1 [Schlesneria sp.]|nr:dnaE2 1 [Schlesneria sp.]
MDGQPLPARRATEDQETHRTPAETDRGITLRSLFPDGVGSGSFCPRAGHSLPGTGVGRELRCLLLPGVTSVDPDRIDVLFERFISRERGEAPDIDVDFEHERREEVLQYIYNKYGRERAGMTAEVITYRPKSAVPDVGKALGLSLDRVDILAKAVEHSGMEKEALAHRFREA